MVNTTMDYVVRENLYETLNSDPPRYNMLMEANGLRNFEAIKRGIRAENEGKFVGAPRRTPANEAIEEIQRRLEQLEVANQQRREEQVRLINQVEERQMNRLDEIFNFLRDQLANIDIVGQLARPMVTVEDLVIKLRGCIPGKPGFMIFLHDHLLEEQDCHTQIYKSVSDAVLSINEFKCEHPELLCSYQK